MYIMKHIILTIYWLLLISIWHMDYIWDVEYYGSKKLVTVYDNQFEAIQNKWYDFTRLLDILAIRSTECNKINWDCLWIWWADYWPFQINQIHRKQYLKSFEFRRNKDWEWLFNYQLDYANWLVESYMKRYCRWERVKTNKERFECVYRAYNWSKNKRFYAKIAWKKREKIKDYIQNIKK